MTHSDVWHDSLGCVTWLIRMCDLRYSTCVTCLIYVCDMCVTCVWHVCGMIHACVWHTWMWGVHHTNLRDTLQHTAIHCNTLQHAATHCNTLQHTATRCNTLPRRWRLGRGAHAQRVLPLQHSAATNSVTHCNTLQHRRRIGRGVHAQRVLPLQHTATLCFNTLQHTATHCNTLQHTATQVETRARGTCAARTTTATLCCNTQCIILQHAATHCNTLQHTATHCNAGGDSGVGRMRSAYYLVYIRESDIESTLHPSDVTVYFAHEPLYKYTLVNYLIYIHEPGRIHSRKRYWVHPLPLRRHGILRSRTTV